MTRRKLQYLRIKKDDLDFAMHYLPDCGVVADGSELYITFDNTVLSMSFYKDKDTNDGNTLMRTEIRTREGDDSSPVAFAPVAFGNLYDCVVKDDDMKKAIRTAIEMGKAFDIAYGYKKMLLKGA